MSGISIDEVTKVYPNGVKAVDALSLDIAEGEFCVLVGPSGCGKSTLLRMIAGLEEVTMGDVSIGGVDVTDKPPQERDIAMVFQNYALYPHMTVKENLAFGLKIQKLPKAEWQKRVVDVAKTLGLEELLERKPAALSGGQRQRVAMGRAIVREPKAFLMDEPLSNLDAKLRVSMRAELAKLHERLGVTTVYVTHDQVEAMTLGERVAVLRDGVLQQFDTPQNLFRRPVNLFVAAFIGSPSMNLIDAEVANGRVTFADISFDLPPSSPAAGFNGSVILGIRPTDFEHGATAKAEHPRLHVRPDVVEDLGSEQHVIFTLDAPRVTAEAVRAASDEAEDEGKLFADDRAAFTAVVDSRTAIPAGSVELAVDGLQLHFFDPATGLVLAGGRSSAVVAQLEPVEDFLQGRRIACLATEEPDGSAYLTAVWFLYEDGIVHVGTSGSSRKARNAAARPRAAVMIDSRGPGPQRGVATSGPVTLLRGAEARAVNDRILRRYLTPAGVAAPDVGLRIAASDDVTIRIEAGRWRTWSTSEDFDGRLEALGMALPLENQIASLKTRRGRYLAYGVVGWAIDSVFVYVHTGRRRPSSLANVPVYGLAQPLFEPVHDRIRGRPVVLRACLYGAGILGVEYASGRLMRRFAGSVPWDYGQTRFGIDGLVRLDYLPLWAAFALGLERLHDLLVAERSRRVTVRPVRR